MPDGFSERTGAGIEWQGDLDGDGEIEYLVKGYSVAAGVSVTILAVGYDRSAAEYQILAEQSYRLAAFDRIDDIEGDGNPEIIAKDQDFHFASGGGGADTVFSPIQIIHYSSKMFVPATRDYPKLIEQDAQHWLEGIHNNAWGQGQEPGVYASYLADMYLLGQQEEGIQVFSELCQEYLVSYMNEEYSGTDWDCAEFLSRIQAALSQTGYP